MKRLEFDFPGIQLATVESPDLDTGCTLVKFDKAAQAVVDIRGGAAAVRESSSINELNVDGGADAIVLAGGSSYGLEAASGVMKRLFEERNHSHLFSDIPSVPSAIVYDFRNRKDGKVYPNREMGEAAFDQLKRNVLAYGRAGSGANVHVGKYLKELQVEKAGQGVAYFQKDGIRLLAITVVNAMGNILDFSGQVIRGSLDPKTGKRHSITGELISRGSVSPSQGRGNTTISLVVTNAKVTRTELKRLAVMTHTGMARVIDPFHTPWDGDTLFAATTDDIGLTDSFSAFDLSVISTRLMQEAVLNSFE